MSRWWWAISSGEQQLQGVDHLLLSTNYASNQRMYQHAPVLQFPLFDGVAFLGLIKIKRDSISRPFFTFNIFSFNFNDTYK